MSPLSGGVPYEITLIRLNQYTYALVIPVRLLFATCTSSFAQTRPGRILTLSLVQPCAARAARGVLDSAPMPCMVFRRAPYHSPQGGGYTLPPPASAHCDWLSVGPRSVQVRSGGLRRPLLHSLSAPNG